MKVKIQQIYNDGSLWEGEAEVPDKEPGAALQHLSAALTNTEPTVMLYRAIGYSGVLLIEWLRSPSRGWVQVSRAPDGTPGPGTPNLDAMPASELVEFAETTKADVGAAARRLFPQRPIHYLAATRSLMEYASAKVSEMNCRERGDIPAAKRYEAICDGIYEALPKYARWWSHES